jgi:hypothetical protein
MVIYQIFVFGADRKSNMAVRAHTLWALAAMLDFRSAPKTKNNLVYDHTMNISAMFDSNLLCGFRKKDENPLGFYVKQYVESWWPS